MYFECRVLVNSCTQLLGISASWQESGPANAQLSTDGAPASNIAAGISSAAFPQILAPQVLRTEPFTIQSGTTRLYASVNANMFGSSGGYACDFFTSDWQVRKVVPS